MHVLIEVTAGRVFRIVGDWLAMESARETGGQGGKRKEMHSGQGEGHAKKRGKCKSGEANLFKGVEVFNDQGVQYHRVRLRIGKKLHRFGRFRDPVRAALVYDYLILRMFQSYGFNKRQTNTMQYSLEPGDDMMDADHWLEDIFLAMTGFDCRNESMFRGVRPIVAHETSSPGPRLRFQIFIRVKGEEYSFGDYGDDCVAALAYDYAVRQLHTMYGFCLAELNLDQYLLQSDEEKAKIDCWLVGVMEDAACPTHGIRLSSDGSRYEVTVTLGTGKRIHVGFFGHKRLAALAYDYVCRLLGLHRLLNFPSSNLDDYPETRQLLDKQFGRQASSDLVEIQYAHALAKFRALVSEGPEYVCCACNQLWFKTSVVRMTPAFVDKASSGRTRGVLSDSSAWVCRTCYRHICGGRVPPSCCLKYSGFAELPAELQGLSDLESDLIAMRIAFMKIRGLGVSAKNVSQSGKSNPLGQLCMTGMVVNVPVDLSQIQLELPRTFDTDDTILIHLKRRLRYKGYYEADNVRPWKIMQALLYLVTHDTLWREANVRLKPDWERLARASLSSQHGLPPPDSVSHSDPSSGSDLESDSHAENSDADEPEDLGPQAHAADEETLINDDVAVVQWRDSAVNVAPGEGQVPLSIYQDKDCEEMAFPAIFAGCRRPETKLSYNQICRIELRNADRRAAVRISNIFFKFRKSQLMQVRDVSRIRVRKTKMQNRPPFQAGQLCQPEERANLVKANIGFRDLKRLRGSPEYDDERKKHAFAMVRQLGSFTFFLTLSMGDTKWPEYKRCLSRILDGKHITLEEAKNLPFKTVARLVRNDPVTSARYHRFRVDAILQTLRDCPSILGKIQDHV